jgi:hypothetical protein
MMFDLSKLKPNDWGPATVLIVVTVVAIGVTGAVLLITTGELPEGFQEYVDNMTKLAGITAFLGGARALHSGLNANAHAKAVSGAGRPISTSALDAGDRPLDDATVNDVTPEMIAAAMAQEAMAQAQAGLRSAGTAIFDGMAEPQPPAPPPAADAPTEDGAPPVA